MLFGAFIGQRIHLDQEKWIRLGREAFLVAQGHRFDQYLTSTSTVAGYVIGSAIFALGLGVRCEGTAYAVDKIIGRLFPKKIARA